MNYPTKLIPFKDFIQKYPVNEDQFNTTKLVWNELELIYEDYIKYESQLNSTAQYIANMMMAVSGVHSVRYRVKSPEHLIEKIIRKTINNPTDVFSVENYKSRLTDLVGIRALHLFKNDWEDIHKFIMTNWDLNETPTANYREGDSKELIETFEKNGCVSKVHPSGYRSIHYIVKMKPAKLEIFCEVQVRTVFEEAWSEIDHTIRYPYDLDNKIFGNYLMILNRFAGNADEMGTYLLFLKAELIKQEKQHQERVEIQSNEIKKKDDTIFKLRKIISKLEVNSELKASIENSLDVLSKPITRFDNNIKTHIIDSQLLLKAIELSSKVKNYYPSQFAEIANKLDLMFNNPTIKAIQNLPKLPPGLK